MNNRQDFIRQIPFTRMLVSLIAGILLFEYFPNLNGHFALAAFICAFIALSAHAVLQQRSNLSYKLRWLFGCGVCLFFAALGFLISWQQNERQQFLHLNEEGFFIAEIIAAPTQNAKSHIVQVRTLSFSKDSIHFVETQGNAAIYIKKDKNSVDIVHWRVGDHVLIYDKFEPIKAAANPQSFDYSQYMRRRGFRATTHADTIFIDNFPANRFSFLQLASDTQKRLLQTYRKYNIEGEEFGVLAALTLGHRDNISEDLYESYSNSGAMHILSVSGLHVGIVYAVFAFLFSFLEKLPRGRLLKALIIIALLWTYAFITGLSPSVMRASMMFSLMAFGKSLQYKPKTYNTIFFSAFILLLINPQNLFNTGFQLSYTAVLGIVFFQPKIKNMLYIRNRFLRWSWDLFCVSVAAQIGTFPLGIYYFSKFSNYFLLTNFLAIPLSTMVIYLAILLFAVANITVIANVVAFLLKYTLKILNGSVVMVDNLPFSILQTWFGKPETLLFYLIIFGATVFILQKRFPVLLFTLCCLTVFGALRLERLTASKNKTEMIVYSDWQSTAVDFIQNGEHSLFSTDMKRTKKLTKYFWLKNRLASPLMLNDTSQTKRNPAESFFVFHGKKIGILTDTLWQKKIPDKKMQLDYLVLGNKSKIRFSDIRNLFDVKQVVVDDTYSNWETKKLQQECLRNSIAFHSTRNDGAFIVRFDN